MSEATYTVHVDRRGEHPTVTITHHDRLVAVREIKTVGHWMTLGQLLTNPDTPNLPTLD